MAKEHRRKTSAGRRRSAAQAKAKAITGEVALQKHMRGNENNADATPEKSGHPHGTPALLQQRFLDSELVFGLVAAVGTDLGKIRSVLEDRLRVLGYSVTQIRISEDVIPVALPGCSGNWTREYERVNRLMDAGDDARRRSGDNSVLALGAAAYVNAQRPRLTDDRPPQHVPKHAYIISSLKHPAEVARLRDIYPLGFYLIGVHADEERRRDFLIKDKGMTAKEAERLMARDADEDLKHGQKVTNTFHLSDFFVRLDQDEARLKQSVWRILALLFSNPYVTPTFDEYAMFLAFTASLRSADLSRQVGAVVTVDEQVVATGANDCPKAGGGLYSAVPYKLPSEVTVEEDGRDYVRGYDANQKEEQEIVEDILKRAADAGVECNVLSDVLAKCRIHDLTEFGRAVHAEMDALLACGRARIKTKGGTVYSTTFPCHNCAKHIIAAGIERVVFVEPYEKSKAVEFHPDSIVVGFNDAGGEKGTGSKVRFEPFVGVGPRRFFDLFSIRLGSGYPVDRKDKLTGRTIQWEDDLIRLRLQMRPASYLDLELLASGMFNQARKTIEERK